MDLWDEWTSHIPPLDPDYTESEETDFIEAEKEKKNGNEAFTKGLYRRAIRHFTNAIELVGILGGGWETLLMRRLCRIRISRFIR